MPTLQEAYEAAGAPYGPADKSRIARWAVDTISCSEQRIAALVASRAKLALTIHAINPKLAVGRLEKANVQVRTVLGVLVVEDILTRTTVKG